MVAIAAPWPTEIRLRKSERQIEIDYDDGQSFTMSAELLRVESPSAEVQGHGGSAKPPPVAGKADVSIVDVMPIGNYAVRLKFDDGHDSGLYSWDYLLTLGQNQDQRWQQYLDRLSEYGLART